MNPDLERWIRTATDGLAEISREEIRREIASHYEEALQAHRSDGLDEEAAHGAALADLGDPVAANRGFRKSHFTEKEWKHVVGLTWRSWRVRPVPTLLIGLFVVAYFVGYAAAYHRWDTLWLIPALAVSVWPCRALQRWAVRRFGLRGGIVAMATLVLATWYGIGSYLGGPAFPGKSKSWVVNAIDFAIFGSIWYFGFLGRVYGPIWRKAWRLKGRPPLAG